MVRGQAFPRHLSGFASAIRVDVRETAINRLGDWICQRQGMNASPKVGNKEDIVQAVKFFQHVFLVFVKAFAAVVFQEDLAVLAELCADEIETGSGSSMAVDKNEIHGSSFYIATVSDASLPESTKM